MESLIESSGPSVVHDKNMLFRSIRIAVTYSKLWQCQASLEQAFTSQPWLPRKNRLSQPSNLPLWRPWNIFLPTPQKKIDVTKSPLANARKQKPRRREEIEKWKTEDLQDSADKVLGAGKNIVIKIHLFMPLPSTNIVHSLNLPQGWSAIGPEWPQGFWKQCFVQYFLF